MRKFIELDIEGMCCDGCARHVTDALQAVPGVEEAHIPDWRNGQARVLTTREDADREILIRAVERIGYKVHGWREQDANASPPAARSGNAEDKPRHQG